jgi:hypothetical protein
VLHFYNKTNNQIGHIFLDRRRYSSTLDVRLFRAADCDTDHYLVVTKVGDRLTVSKQKTHTFNVETLNLKKLNEVEGKEHYHVEISNRFPASENFDEELDINRARETIRENTQFQPKNV